MIRVAQILAGSAHGGAENFYVRLVQGLHASGKIEQKAFIRNHQHRLESLLSAGVPALGYRFGGSVHIIDRKRYLKALQSYQPDIVMTWMNRASKLTPNGNYKLISRLGHYYNLKYYRHSDYWIGNTKGICDHLVKGGMPADRVFHITNFADETSVSPLSRESFDTPKGVPLLLSAGRLHVNKGFDTLLQALVDIPDVMLWLAGSGPEEQSLKQLCEKLGLDERVRFLGWRTDVAALMRTADLFVCPSRYEGLGSIVLESWVNQCPIVSTASGGPSELITDAETGLLTPIDQPVPLAATIQCLLANPAHRALLAKNAEERYWKKYSKAVVVESYENCFLEIVK